MAVYKTRNFAREAERQDLKDSVLCEALDEIRKGLFDAKLGANLFKKRIGRVGGGKRSGLRSIVVFKSDNENVFCIHLFAKSEKDNISSSELISLKRLGKMFLEMGEEEVSKAVKENLLEEVIQVGKKENKR